MSRRSSGMLLDERMVTAQPSLVRTFGLTNAVVLQQIHWHIEAAEHGIEHDEHEWFPVTQEILAGEIGVTREVVRRAVDALEERGVLLSCQPEGRASRRKWYRIEHEHEAFSELANPPNGNRADAQLGIGESADSSTPKPVEPREPSRSSVASDDTSRANGETSARRPRARSPRDDIWDALVEVYGEPSKGQAAFVGKTITALMEAPDCTADEVRRRGRLARAHWPGSSMAALDKHWGALATMPPPPAGRRVRAEESETRTMRDPGQTGEVTSL